MSNKTFTVPLDQTASTCCVSNVALQISPENTYDNFLMSPSPDSDNGGAYGSDREANKSPVLTLLQCSLGETPLVDNLYTDTPPQEAMLCGANMNLNQTFIATPMKGSVNLWTKNLLINQDTSQESHTSSENMEDGKSDLITSLESASSCSVFERGSMNNDHCSYSSGEMVMRSNSFCLQDQSLLSVTSLEDSSSLSDNNYPALLPDCKVLSSPLPDVCEGLTEKVTEENVTNDGHVALGMTFIQADIGELPIEEKYSVECIPLVALPSETEDCLLKTFVYENSSADSGKEEHSGVAETDLLFHLPGAITPEHGKTIVSTLSALHDTDKDIHTSTPIQTFENQTPVPPSFSESPFTENGGSPALQPGKQQHVLLTPKQQLSVEAARPTCKSKTTEIKSTKSNFSHIKSKFMPRGFPQISIPGLGSKRKLSQNNMTKKPSDGFRTTTIRISPVKGKRSSEVVATDDAKQSNTDSRGHAASDGPSKDKVSAQENHKTRKDHPATLQNNSNTEEKQATLNQEPNVTVKFSGNQTFCISPVEGSPDSTEPRSDLNKDTLNKTQARPGEGADQRKPVDHKTRLSWSSESSTKPQKEKGKLLRSSNSFSNPKPKSQSGLILPGNLVCSSQNKQRTPAENMKKSAEKSARGIRKISLVAESSSPTTDESQRKSQVQPSPRPSKVPPPAVTLRAAAALSNRPRPAVGGRDEPRVPARTPQFKEKGITGSQRGNTAAGTASAIMKSRPHGSQTSQVFTRPSMMRPPATPLPRSPKTPGPAKKLTEAGQPGRDTKGGASASKQTPLKSMFLKARLIPTPGKNTGQSLTTACKPAPPPSKGASHPAVTPVGRSASLRHGRLSSAGLVDKNTPKGGTQQQQQPTQPHRTHGPPTVVPPTVAKREDTDQSLQQLQGLVTASHRGLEALAVVLQRTLIERDESRRQCRELSQELVKLQGDLVCSINSSERLEKEKEELRATLEDALLKLQEQHQNDVSELEQRLQAFYQAHCDKVHLTYQEEADRCKSFMQQQVGELKSSHEAVKLELQSKHVEELQSVKQQYETSLEEHRKVLQQELESLKDTETSLMEKIQELMAQNGSLTEKLRAEENRRKKLAESCQKDTHTLYLEQELESLKVVLDIKNKQLHQQEKKLMEVDKLMEKSVKLDENLTKVQQENEDLKARMERHAALSRQLSTEQAVLQETLQKESKVNKRLSMENEELLWKLHNGDLGSPRKVSPTSTTPTHSFSLQSPRSTPLISNPPLSPR